MISEDAGGGKFLKIHEYVIANYRAAFHCLEGKLFFFSFSLQCFKPWSYQIYVTFKMLINVILGREIMFLDF